MVQETGFCRAGIVLLLVSASAAIVRAAEPAPKRPNVIVILSDDQGYADVGYQGCKDIPTPNIDALARGGVRFSNGYVSCPVCSPTRAGLMTGRYQQRFGHEHNPGPDPGDNFGLPLDQVTLADRMKAAGYVTGIVGKWHLGFDEKRHPLSRGFDEFFGFLAGAHDYFKDLEGTKNALLRGRESVAEPEYLTDAFTREAVAFIGRHANQRFFLYLPYNAVHGPLQAPEKYLKPFAGIADEKRRSHAAMVAALDAGVGAVIKKLRDEGLERNTLVFFLADNGGPTPQTTSSNLPLRGRKGQVLEGGIRVPFLVSWPGTLPEGKTYDAPVISLDIFPTAVAAAGGTPPEGVKLDGVNLLPYLTGRENGRPHEALFWRFGTQAAVRKGDWKLIRRQPTKKNPGPAVELFNLADDIGEAKDLSQAEPEKVKELDKAFAVWEAQMIKPLWTPSPRGKAKAGARNADSQPAKKERRGRKRG